MIIDDRQTVRSGLLPAAKADDPPWLTAMRAINPPLVTIAPKGWFRDRERDATVDEVRALIKR